jgi:hypothetical protein
VLRQDKLECLSLASYFKGSTIVMSIIALWVDSKEHFIFVSTHEWSDGGCAIISQGIGHWQV